MKQHNYDKQHTLIDLVTEYEVMSKKGTVIFYEESVFYSFIDYYQSEQDYDSALATVKDALQQHNFSALLHYKKAQLLSILCHDSCLEQALEAIVQAENLSPTNMPIQLLKAQLLARQQNFSEAFAIIDQLKDNSLEELEELAEVYYYEGLLFEQLGNYESMYYRWSEGLLLNPNHTEIWQRIWMSIERSQKFEECAQLFRAIVDEEPYCHLAWFYLGHSLSYQNRYEEAVDAYEYAFVIDNKFEEAYKECAANCLIMNDYAKALDFYQEALLHVEPDGELLYNIGRCYQYQGIVDIALNFYEEAIEFDEYNDEIYFHIGTCSIEQGKLDTAIEYFKKAIDLDNRQEHYYSALALTYYKLGELEKAFNCFNTATELAPEDPTLWVDFATFLLNIDYTEEALHILVKSDDSAYGAELLYCRVACLYKLGRDKEAIDVLAEALQEDFDKHQLLLDLIPNLLEQKVYASAIRYYRLD